MNRAIRSVLLSFWFAVTNVQLLPCQNAYAMPILAGISNHGQNKSQPYVTAGDRTYLIGTQDGNFPDMGEHVPGEMGGLWLHPIKLIDGFWATVTDMATNQEIALSESTEFVNYPYGNRFRYGPVLDGLEIERFQFSPDGQEGLIVQYAFKNAGARKKQLRFHFSVKTDLRPMWLSDRLGIADAQDAVTWQTTSSLFIAKADVRHRGLGDRQEGSGKHLQVSRQESCGPLGKETGTLCCDYRKGESTNSRPTPARGLQLGEGQQRVACQGRPRHRSRSRWRTHGIHVVVRDRD